jgi:hypothetical protein
LLKRKKAGQGEFSMRQRFESTNLRIGSGIVADSILIAAFPLSVFAILLSGGYDPNEPGCAERHILMTLALLSLVFAIGIFTWLALQPWHIEGRILLHLVATIIAMLVFASLGFGSGAFMLAIGAATLTSPAVLIPLPEEVVGRRVVAVTGWNLCNSMTIN